MAYAWVLQTLGLFSPGAKFYYVKQMQDSCLYLWYWSAVANLTDFQEIIAKKKVKSALILQVNGPFSIFVIADYSFWEYLMIMV